MGAFFVCQVGIFNLTDLTSGGWSRPVDRLARILRHVGLAVGLLVLCDPSGGQISPVGQVGFSVRLVRWGLWVSVRWARST